MYLFPRAMYIHTVPSCALCNEYCMLSRQSLRLSASFVLPFRNLQAVEVLDIQAICHPENADIPVRGLLSTHCSRWSRVFHKHIGCKPLP